MLSDRQIDQQLMTKNAGRWRPWHSRATPKEWRKVVSIETPPVLLSECEKNPLLFSERESNSLPLSERERNPLPLSKGERNPLPLSERERNPLFSKPLTTRKPLPVEQWIKRNPLLSKQSTENTCTESTERICKLPKLPPPKHWWEFEDDQEYESYSVN